MIYASYVIILIGILCILFSAIFSHRKGESEISTSISEHPAFKIGVVATILGIIFRIILIFI